MSTLFLAEFVGTLILIFLGNGVVANVLLNKSKGNGGGWIVITTGWAFAIAVSVYITGGVSGAHMNPALSIALVLTGAMEVAKLPVYIAAQMLGAIAGQCLVYLMYKQHYDETEDTGLVLATFSTGPAIRNKFWNILSEILATAMLVFAILGVGRDNNLGAYLVAIIVWSMGLSLGGPTGYAMNPARDLGPRIAHQFLPLKHKGDGDWDYAIVPIVGPIIGAIIGAFLAGAFNGIAAAFLGL